ncbi:hypothetical protein FX988_03442 [Paraglaciecola mesophila]|uniref:Aerotolerance regulator N-terminal domain-containing protein n=1 Tax=Paraglaciecola mesophila TaxID=197222 RepID=A0A857JMR9_9ALTE|nr:hypothetical protein [Paraglaciecola mesophila]QHJ13183.1 hypothetical protein FX988_03442 [Paraglaciecola mesophila]
MNWQLAHIGPYTLNTPDGMPLGLCLLLGAILLLAWVFSSLFMLKKAPKAPSEKSLFTGARATLLLSINTLAFIFLLGTLLDITSTSTQTIRAVLVTKGATPELLDSLKNQAPESINIEANTSWFTMLTDLPIEQAQYLPSASLLPRAIGELNELIVVGDGLSPAQWQSLFAAAKNWGSPNQSNIAITFVPSNKAVGIGELTWQKQLTMGDTLSIRGTLQSADEQGQVAAESYLLQLISPSGEVEQTQTLKSGQPFTLKARPKAAGQWRYELRLQDKRTQALIEQSDIAISISENSLPDDTPSDTPDELQVNTPRLAIWQSSPSFETKHLKQWASATGSPVTVVSQISQDAYQRQYVNQPKPDTGTENQNRDPFYQSSTLDNIDLLFIDGRGLIRLSSSQRARLRLAVANGLGLLILADGNLVANQNTALTEALHLPLLREDKQAKDAFSIVYPNSSAQSRTDATLTTSAIRFDGNEGDTLLAAPNGRPLVKRQPLGLGHVAVTLLPRTYEWKLNQTNGAYEQLWHYLAQQVARNTQDDFWLQEQNNQLTFTNKQSQACLRTSKLRQGAHGVIEYIDQQSGEIAQQPLILNQRPDQPNIWCTHYWPSSPGWLRISLKGQQGNLNEQQISSLKTTNAPLLTPEQYRYVYPATDWLAQQQASKHNASKSVAALSSERQVDTTEVPINKGLLFACLVFLLSLLWIARRLL